LSVIRESRQQTVSDQQNDPHDISHPALASDALVFTADLGGTHLRAATVDRSGEIHFRLKQKHTEER